MAEGEGHTVLVECRGYNGTITVAEQALTITHSGLTAKAGGLVRDVPRTIPLQAVSSVNLQDASRMTNGWLTLGLGGVPAASLGAGSAGSDANTVMFRHKDKDQFQTLYDWLLTVVKQNESLGIDASAVEFDAAGQTRLEGIQQRSAERIAHLEGKQATVEAKAAESTASRLDTQEQKMSELLGDDRPDIVAAAARMGWRMGGKRELKKLASHLHAGESVQFIAQGTYANNQGILVLTDVRLLFLFHGVVSQAKEDFPLRLISSVQTKSGFATGEMTVFVSGNSSSISGIVKGDLEPLADAVRQGIVAPPSTSAVPTSEPAAAAPTAADPYEALQRLASLRDAGILTEEEFTAKKQELLERM